MRLLLGALVVIAGLLVLQRWGAADRAVRETFALASGTIRLADLEEPVEVLRDARGIPHVLAESEAEAWFGLGFVHAQDRLAQMTWLRRHARGRLAEVEGAEALPADRLARLLEIGRAADAAAEELPADSREVLEAYALGVNARIARIKQGRVAPPAALALQIGAVDPWVPGDSLAVVKLLSWCMGGTLETTLVLDDLIQRLDSVPARPFFPGRSSVDFGVAPNLPTQRDAAAAPKVDAETRAPIGSTRALCEGIGTPTGGAWVLGKRFSESRAPIVLADWHLAPSAPALFYEVHLSAGSLKAAGASMPGSPILWAGRNAKVAWAGVPASAPVADLFIETLRVGRGLYQNGKLWAPLSERVETLRFRDPRGGEPSESELLIRSTRHGPLIEAMVPESSDAAEDGEGERHRAARALSWTGARAGDGLTSMLALMRAKNAEDVLEALETHHEPVLAFAYADAKGEGGVQVAGWLAKRPLPTGLVPVQGRLRSFDWRERVPLASLPNQTLSDSEKDWVIALDQAWPKAGGLDQTEWLWRPGDRAVRLNARLTEQRAEGRLDLRAASELLEDDVASRAPRVVAAALGLARRGKKLAIEAEEVARLLERWDGSMSAESGGAAAYHLLIDRLLKHLLEEPFGPELFARYLNAPHVDPQHAIERLLIRSAALNRESGWTDADRVGEAARLALRETWIQLNHHLGPTRERWAWGALHKLQFSPLGPSKKTDEKIGPTVQTRGSGQTLSYAHHRPGVSFDVEKVGLYQVAMDLSESDRLLSTLVPGQSEHPGHPHHLSGLARHQSKRLSIFATSRLVVEQESAERLLLEPAP
ncbi:MAG: penicillin acylase family protein [Myxococcota bacterium]